jgi:hypothetical protein
VALALLYSQQASYRTNNEQKEFIKTVEVDLDFVRREQQNF